MGEVPMALKGRDILRVADFTKRDLERVFDLADEYGVLLRKGEHSRILEGKVLMSLFFNPSTRTQFGFATAMAKLSGSVVGFTGTEYTSFEKGEDFDDGIRMFDYMADVLLFRHNGEGAAQRAADIATHPVINCGDGWRVPNCEHPTQGFLETYAIKKFKGELKDLNVVMMGDLWDTRSNHSTAYGLAMFGAHLIFSSPKQLAMPDFMIKEMKEKYNAKISCMDPKEAMAAADILYLIPLVYPFPKLNWWADFEGTFRVNLDMVRKYCKSDVILMEAGPREQEYAKDIDGTKHSGYLEMYEKYSIPVRMAILALVLGAAE